LAPFKSTLWLEIVRLSLFGSGNSDRCSIDAPPAALPDCCRKWQSSHWQREPPKLPPLRSARASSSRKPPAATSAAVAEVPWVHGGGWRGEYRFFAITRGPFVQDLRVWLPAGHQPAGSKALSPSAPSGFQPHHGVLGCKRRPTARPPPVLDGSGIHRSASQRFTVARLYRGRRRYLSAVQTHAMSAFSATGPVFSEAMASICPYPSGLHVKYVPKSPLLALQKEAHAPINPHLPVPAAIPAPAQKPCFFRRYP